MALDRSFWAQTAIESILIVFSVLLALFLNDAWTRRAEQAATQEQLDSIRAELRANRKILDELYDGHEQIAENLAQIRTAANHDDLIVDHRLQLERVLGRSLADQMVRDTAWETAKATGLVRNFDLECANLLTDIYGLQGTVESTIWEIAEFLGERETHEPERLDQTLVLLEMSLQELQGQERLLVGAYDEALTRFDTDGCQV